MARAWITDLWVRDADIEMPDGSRQRVSPTAAQLRAITKLPAQFRTAKFGRGKRWRVVWYELDGGKRRERGRSFAAKSDAEAFTAALEDDLRVGRYRRPEDAERPFREVAEDWIASKHSVKGSTLNRYRRELDVYVLPRWGDVRLMDITDTDVNAWIDDLRNARAPVAFTHRDPEKARPFGAAMLRHVVNAVFGAVLRDAVQRGYLAVSPLARIRLPKITPPSGGRLYLTVEQIEQLADGAAEAAGDGTALMIRTMAYTGIRIGEAAALRVGDFEAAQRRLHVSRTVTIDADGAFTVGTPKSGKPRRVPVPDFLVPELAGLVRGRSKTEPLFRSMRGAAVNVHNWRSREWAHSLRAAGFNDLEGLTVHTLRHSYASLAIRSGADVKTLQAALGHATAVETLETYAGLWPERLDEVADAISEVRRETLAAAAAHDAS